MLLLLLACEEPSKTTDDTQDEGEPRQVEDTETVTLYGCVRGNARDDYNIGEKNVAVRAFAPDTCDPAGETTGDLGGDFCLDQVPLGVVEVQVYYAEGRCVWWHGYPTQVGAEGDCTTPEVFVDLGTLFECYGETLVCDPD